MVASFPFFRLDAKHRNETLNEEIKTLSHKVHAQLKSMFFCVIILTP